MDQSLTGRVQRLLAAQAVDPARALVEDARAQAPDERDTLRASAYLDFAVGEDEAALAHLERALQHWPDDDALRQEYAELLASAGHREDAIVQLRAIVDRAPDWRRAFELGRLLYETGREDEAVDLFERALQGGAPEPMARRALAESLFQSERYDAAEPHFAALAAMAPQDVELLLRRAQCAARAGRLAAAQRLLDEAPAARCADPRVELARGRLAEDSGDAEAARGAYRRAMQAAPGWPEPVAALVMLDAADPPADALHAAGVALQDARTHPQDLAYLHYALGKAADRRGAHEEAWAHWASANAMRRGESPDEDADALARRVDLLKSLYTPERVARLRAQVPTDPRPVLVVGMPRSGTTLVEQILASHGQVHGAGELPTLAQTHASVQAALASDADIDIASHSAAYLERLSRGAPADPTRLVDKQPYNFFFLGLAAALVPGMRVVWCRRDPRDIAVSIFGENFSARSRYATDLGEIRALHDAQVELMEHWRAALGIEVLELRYEQLVEDFEPVVREMLGFLELPWDPACLEFHRTERAVQTNSRWQVRQPLHARSIGRWRHYAGPLRDAGFDVVEPQAG